MPAGAPPLEIADWTELPLWRWELVMPSRPKAGRPEAGLQAADVRIGADAGGGEMRGAEIADWRELPRAQAGQVQTETETGVQPSLVIRVGTPPIRAVAQVVLIRAQEMPSAALAGV